jgi:hypothetical protein
LINGDILESEEKTMKKRMVLATVLVCAFMFGAVTAYAQTNQDYKDFSTGDRLGTWALNAWVFPGLGSYILMKDWVGGSIQLGAGVAGDVLLVIGLLDLYRGLGILDDSYRVKTDNFSDRDREDRGPFLNQSAMDRGVMFLVISGSLMLANQIFNIIRSVTYHKPLPELAIFNPESWNIAILPGNDGGIERVSLSYTIKL